MQRRPQSSFTNKFKYYGMQKTIYVRYLFIQTCVRTALNRQGQTVYFDRMVCRYKVQDKECVLSNLYEIEVKKAEGSTSFSSGSLYHIMSSKRR